VALQMKKLGFQRVRPLEGGFSAWVAAAYPVEDRVVRIRPAAMPT
jgi:3-mercaptopyruvate sulfurtransferase SseA